MDSSTQPIKVISLKGWQWFLAGVLMTTMLFGGVSACYQGRDLSRWTGRPVNIELPPDITNPRNVISISFHKDNEGATVKDVTYIGQDGNLHSKEYRDWNLLEGEIIWEVTAPQE